MENKEKGCAFSPNPNGLLLLLLLNSSFPTAVALLLLLLLTVCPPDAAAADLRLASDDLTGALLLPEAEAVAVVAAEAPDNSAFKSEKLSEVRIRERLDKLSKLMEPLII